MSRMMIRLADEAERFVRAIGNALAWTGLAMVLVVAFNVCARYLFSFGSVAMQEVEWHLMAVGALFGMPYALNRGEEVRVDVLYAHFPPAARRWVDGLGALLLTAASVYVVWLAIGFVDQAYALNEGSPDPGGLPARWLLKAAIPAAFALLALQSLATVLRIVTGSARTPGADTVSRET